MFKIGQYVLDKKTNKKGIIYSKSKEFYLVKFNEGYVTGKFEWELTDYNFLKMIIRRIKKWKKIKKVQ